jgi:hypothetical protein
MLSRQSRAGIWGQAGMSGKWLKIRSRRRRGSVCGKLPTTVGMAAKAGHFMVYFEPYGLKIKYNP